MALVSALLTGSARPKETLMPLRDVAATAPSGAQKRWHAARLLLANNIGLQGFPDCLREADLPFTGDLLQGRENVLIGKYCCALHRDFPALPLCDIYR